MSYFEQRMAEIRAEQLKRFAEPPARVPPPKPHRPRKGYVSGHVYFLRCGDNVKIGFSVDVRERERTLRTGNAEHAFVCKVIPGDLGTERDFHTRFAAYRRNGEWFELRGELARYLERAIHPIDLPKAEKPEKPEPPPFEDFRL